MTGWRGSSPSATTPWLPYAGLSACSGAVVRNMTMIGQRRAEVETRQQAGHWEGDLIVGTGSASAMMTLRERKTHCGIVVNLPAEHTAQTVSAAATKAFASLPPHMKRNVDLGPRRGDGPAPPPGRRDPGQDLLR
jgi:hypothetical protein